MESLLKFLETYRTGILMLLVCLASLVMLIQWIAWIFSQGRFDRSTSTGVRRREDSLRYVFSDAVVKIINDFRHLLALIVVLIFAGALTYAMYATQTLDGMKDALQAVTATLGGLVGSIIGYYFGESSIAKPVDGQSRTAVQQPATAIPAEQGGEQGAGARGAQPQGADQNQPNVAAEPIRRAPPLPPNALDNNG